MCGLWFPFNTIFKYICILIIYTLSMTCKFVDQGIHKIGTNIMEIGTSWKLMIAMYSLIDKIIDSMMDHLYNKFFYKLAGVYHTIDFIL